MSRQRRSEIAFGLLLLLAGAFFLAQQLYPALRFWDYFVFSWPWYVIGAGAALLILGLILGVPSLAVPACIVAGVGAILFYQNETGNWESWSYAWTLIPGFVGIGILLAELFSGNMRAALRGGGTLIVISALLFTIFGAFLGGLAILQVYWPVLLILLGVWFLIRPFTFRRAKEA